MDLYPWQERLVDAMIKNKRQKMTMFTARQLGKSVCTQQAIDRLMHDLNSQPVSDLILSEGHVYGSRYYCVEPIGGNWMKMEVWVNDTYGATEGSIWAETDRPAPKPAERWYMNNRKFWFRNEADRIMFVLKWR
jgi:hypothetical protein